jgi:hypothetical protein
MQPPPTLPSLTAANVKSVPLSGIEPADGDDDDDDDNDDESDDDRDDEVDNGDDRDDDCDDDGDGLETG